MPTPEKTAATIIVDSGLRYVSTEVFRISNWAAPAAGLAYDRCAVGAAFAAVLDGEGVLPVRNP